MQRGVATFTLDTGRCPPWLFRKMVRLGRLMTEVMIADFGPDEFIKRIADPVWFQALGTVLAFDWNASGLTTILTAALKESIRGSEKELGVFICGGKGKTSRKTPQEITDWASRLSLPDGGADSLVYNSRMAAKVDSALIQDGFDLYHHSFFFSKNGSWAVVQQGMNTTHGSARRYHWYSADVKELVREPHSAIISDLRRPHTLNMTANESGQARDLSVELLTRGYNTIMKDITLLERYSSPLHKVARYKVPEGQLTLLKLEDTEFHTHPVMAESFQSSHYLQKILALVTDRKPESYEKFVAMPGVGARTVRALSLVSEVIYGAKPSYTDPARYSFAHGGKDATPYPIDRPTYRKTIEIMEKVVRKMKVESKEKAVLLRKLR